DKYPILHTKIYRFYLSKKRACTYLIGSANASSAAFERNEEILIKTGNSPSLSKYCNALFRESTKIEEFRKIKKPISSLVGFFQRGFLLIKYPYPVSLTFKFESLKDFKQTDSQIIGLGKGEKFGEFNLENYFRLDRPGKGEQIKRYSIQTNLGLWVPTFYLNQVESIFDEKADGKHGHYQDLLESMQRQKPEKVLKELWKKIKIHYQGLDIPINKEMERFKKWYFRIEDKLIKICSRESKTSIDSQGVTSSFTKELYLGNDVFYITPMPSIWNDDSEAEEFIDYFFDAVLNFGGGIGSQSTSSFVAISIKNLLAGEEARDLRIEFENHLKTNSWDDANWRTK
ncbi:MAG: hypothetical protein L6Q65_13980, partial [Zoogloea sp.]|nr:hypothetical protein [Zoogloea sp.]